MTPYHSQYWAHLLTLKGAGGSIENLTRSFSNARVDLNPHQVDAALFALRSPLSKGAIRRLAEIDLRTQAVNLFTELVGTTSG